MEEHQKKAFDFAADLTKQLITLSTALIALTVTFSTDIVGTVNKSYTYLLLISWIVFIFSILCGILTLMALTGNLDPMSKKKKKHKKSNYEASSSTNPILTITSPNVTSSSKLQIFSFLIALILTCLYGYFSIINPSHANNNNNDYPIIRESKLSTDSTTYIDTLYLPKTK